MSTRTPWWYSGDGEEDSPEAPAQAPALETAASRPDGDDRPPGDEPEHDDSKGGGGRDWTALVAGAQRMVDWATERVMAPHAEHDDPREHPDCVLCRTMTVLGDVGLRSAPSPEAGGDQASDGAEGDDAQEGALGATGPTRIAWIPIRGDTLEP